MTATKGHKCSVSHLSDTGVKIASCDQPAYRKDLNGKWLCRKHLKMFTAK